jgi:ABC-type lipopolysaccharide export system ATPase subunit
VSSYITIFNPLVRSCFLTRQISYAYPLFQTLFTAAIHEQQVLADDKGVADLFVWDAQGLRLFFLFIHIIVHSAILIFTNKGRDPTAVKHFNPPKPRPPMIRPNMDPELAEKLKKQYELATKEPEYDPDVVQEKQRLLGKENEEADEEAPAASDSTSKGSLLKSVGLYKYYNSDVPAVRPMFVGVEGSACFGLLGTNGAGKSTLIGMILGQLSPSGGKVDINQVPVYSTPRTQMYEASLLGACLQDDALWPTLTPREHIDLFLRMRNDLSQYSDHQLAALTQNILAQLRLSSHQSKLAEQLSGGNKRKLCSAIALLCGNKVVLLDECVLLGG